jgi:outer membrane protein assembly factor BamA
MPTRHALTGITIAIVLPLCLWAQVSTREEKIGAERIDKQARLWPEHTAGLVKLLNEYTERGLLEGVQSRKGATGPQLVLGGMRSGNGASAGAGYRRVDLWGERLSYRVTARGTLRKSYMFDVELSSPRLSTERTELTFYAKYENSPMMDYYGPGPNSSKSNRTSYRLEDLGVDFGGRYRVWNRLFAGASLGGYFSNVGRGKRSGIPSTEQVFTPEQAPGLNVQPNLLRVSALLQYDYRDLPAGPREGGSYYGKYQRYVDPSLNQQNFSQLDLVADQYIPYFHKTRVVALRLAVVATWAPAGNIVPFYLRPVLGGNQFLRGFARYRFQDENAILASVEHRWHIFSGGHAALFYDAGKVVPKATQLNLGGIEHSGGIGLRFTLHNAVIMRIDNAVSREGYRFIWTFSNAW